MSSNEASALTSDTASGDVVARAGRYFRNTRYLISVGLIAMGLWFAYDGWVTYPRENQKARDEGKDIMPHPGKDIPLQRALGFALPPLGALLLLRWLYISRGEYRLAGHTLTVPGHPPVPFEMITTIDKRQWDRKGIAYVEYEVNGAHGRLKLDDFIYERVPTDQIYDEIVKFVAPADPEPPEHAPGGFPVVEKQPEIQSKSPET